MGSHSHFESGFVGCGSGHAPPASPLPVLPPSASTLKYLNRRLSHCQYGPPSAGMGGGLRRLRRQQNVRIPMMRTKPERPPIVPPTWAPVVEVLEDAAAGTVEFFD